MKQTKINQEIAKQSIMLRLDRLASQLPPKSLVISSAKQYGNGRRQRHLQHLMLEIQDTHQQLSNIIKDQQGDNHEQ